MMLIFVIEVAMQRQYGKIQNTYTDCTYVQCRVRHTAKKQKKWQLIRILCMTLCTTHFSPTSSVECCVYPDQLVPIGAVYKLPLFLCLCCIEVIIGSDESYVGAFDCPK